MFVNGCQDFQRVTGVSWWSDPKLTGASCTVPDESRTTSLDLCHDRAYVVVWGVKSVCAESLACRLYYIWLCSVKWSAFSQLQPRCVYIDGLVVFLRGKVPYHQRLINLWNIVVCVCQSWNVQLPLCAHRCPSLLDGEGIYSSHHANRPRRGRLYCQLTSSPTHQPAMVYWGSSLFIFEIFLSLAYLGQTHSCFLKAFVKLSCIETSVLWL